MKETKMDAHDTHTYGDAPLVIAVPSELPGGLDAPLGQHFGHCACFTIAERKDGAWETTIVPNVGEHSCVGVIDLLRKFGAQAVAARHMGMRPLMACFEAGLTPYAADTATVREAVELLAAGQLSVMGLADSCGGDGGGHAPHGHGHGHHGGR
jgi:predicted Fe-Mo cluster-binding NifX family protein